MCVRFIHLLTKLHVLFCTRQSFDDTTAAESGNLSLFDLHLLKTIIVIQASLPRKMDLLLNRLSLLTTSAFEVEQLITVIK